MNARFENLNTEWRNQRLRRHVLGRSNQCRTCDLSSLNVFHLLDTLGEWGKGWWNHTEDESGEDAGDADEQVHFITIYDCLGWIVFLVVPQHNE